MSAIADAAVLDREDIHILNGVAEFPMAHIVARYRRDHDLSASVAAEHEVELKRFLALCCVFPKRSYGMKGPVDELWHTFLMFTADYGRFCKQYARGGFIHHFPHDSTSASDGAKATMRSDYEALLEDYENVFGVTPPAHIWPRFRTQHDSGSCTGCKECNGCKATPETNTTQAILGEDETKCGGCSGCTTCSAPEGPR